MAQTRLAGMTDINYKHLVLVDQATDSIRLSQKGLEYLGPRLSKICINPRNIRTKAQFQYAIDRLFASELETIAINVKGKDEGLDELLNGLPGWND